MQMNRRNMIGGLAAIFAAGAAPTLVLERGVLMPVKTIALPPSPAGRLLKVVHFDHALTIWAGDTLDLIVNLGSGAAPLEARGVAIGLGIERFNAAEVRVMGNGEIIAIPTWVGPELRQ